MKTWKGSDVKEGRWSEEVWKEKSRRGPESSVACSGHYRSFSDVGEPLRMFSPLLISLCFGMNFAKDQQLAVCRHIKFSNLSSWIMGHVYCI